MKRKIRFEPTPAMKIFGRIFSALFGVVGLSFVVIGVTEVIPSGAGIFGVVWTLVACMFAGIGIYGAVSRDGLYSMRRGFNLEITDEEPQPPVDKWDAALSGETHDHIPSTALDAKARLEQLETLKEAGLITREEYDQKRREILKGL